MTATLAVIAFCLFDAGMLFMGWALCAAAKRGDQMNARLRRK